MCGQCPVRIGPATQYCDAGWAIASELGRVKATVDRLNRRLAAYAEAEQVSALMGSEWASGMYD